MTSPDIHLLDKIAKAIAAEGIAMNDIQNENGTVEGLELHFPPETSEDDRARASNIAAAVIENPGNYSP